MSKKLNRTEIATLAKRILEEVNEVNRAYNETVKASPAYIAEVTRIESQDPLKALHDKFEKELKIAFGTAFKDSIDFTLRSSWGTNAIRQKQDEIQKEVEQYNLKVLKPIHKTHGITLEKIIDDITIAQIDITDVQMLINTIKAKLI